MARNRKRQIYNILSLKKLLIFGAIFIFLLIFLPSQLQILSRSISSPKIFPTDTLLPPLIQQAGKSLTQQDYIEKARTDLSNKLHIDQAKIKLIKVEEKEFVDTSLGCPQQGKLYAQVITPGYQIAMEEAGETYIYNAGLNIVVICKSSK